MFVAPTLISNRLQGTFFSNEAEKTLTDRNLNSLHWGINVSRAALWNTKRLQMNQIKLWRVWVWEVIWNKCNYRPCGVWALCNHYKGVWVEVIGGETYGGSFDGQRRSVRSFERMKASSTGLVALWRHDAGTGSCCSVGEVLSEKKDKPLYRIFSNICFFLFFVFFNHFMMEMLFFIKKSNTNCVN